jgi:hypothetical protein
LGKITKQMKDKIAQLMSQSTYNKQQQQESFSVEKLKEIIDSMPKSSACDMQFPYPYSNFHIPHNNFVGFDPLKIFRDFNGFRVHESNHIPEETVPKFQLSEKVNVSDEFRAKMNKWLLDFFGTKTVSTMYIVGHNIIANPQAVASLKAI